MQVIYFSCGAHAAYLTLSLRSLAQVSGSFISRVHIGEDPEDPLRAEAKARLGALGLPLAYGMWGKVTGYGETTAWSELRAFRDIAGGMQAGDWIVKVDSDVLFMTDWIFRHVQGQKVDLVGNEERAWGDRYAQGGCYFLRAGWVRQSCDPSRDEVRAMAQSVLDRFHRIAEAKGKWRMPQCPEDAFFHRLVASRGGRIRLAQYYLPIWQLDRLTQNGPHLGLRRLSWAAAIAAPRIAAGVAWHDRRLRRDRYSVIHFMSCKERMPVVAETIRAMQTARRPP